MSVCLHFLDAPDVLPSFIMPGRHQWIPISTYSDPSPQAHRDCDHYRAAHTA
jgi:hypothetical protein